MSDLHKQIEYYQKMCAEFRAELGWGRELWQACLMWALIGPLLDTCKEADQPGWMISDAKLARLIERQEYHLSAGIHVLASRSGLT